MLARLLELNAQRAREEVLAGATKPKKEKMRSAKSAAKSAAIKPDKEGLFS